MENFTKNQDAMRGRIADALGGDDAAAATGRNRAILERTVQMLQPFDADGSVAQVVIREQSTRSAEEIGQLKSEIEEMRRQLAALGAPPKA